uniref:NADH:ubiquinone reductase (H(+)-translocating) n=1 Tax=Cucullanus robustus TaxID=657293 RepID=G4V242_9BILA|nr:NADH dehydrogenase subunit 5 [Cucullanus robustus]ACV96759.1 NADH dehydrogenase subunit 5 [Cucullanus robustus]
MNISVFLIVVVLFIMLFLVFLFPFCKLLIIFFDWEFLGLKFSLMFNSLSFSLILVVVTLSVMFYSSFYLAGEINFCYYYFMLLVFVMSMFFLIFSNSVFTILLMWDLLGISSFFLVLFYNNWDSCSGSMNTALTNRLGDYFLFVFFSFAFLSGCYFLSLSFFICLGSVFLLLASFTKSAQFPFSSWLPKAMSAPTPVSSLVHSSTLVTAGMVLLFNFDSLVLSKEISFLVFFIGLFTMFFSSVAALVEEDLKKVVALSTLSQMGFSMLSLGLGLVFVSLLHLLSHALFKSCLFMQVGYLIHCSFGQQDGRGYSNMGSFSSLIQLQILVTLFCLCGLFFSSGAVSKDYILMFFFSNFFFLFLGLVFFSSVFLTFFYSARLWKSLFMFFSSTVMVYSDSILMNFLSLFLVVGSVLLIWWMNLNFLSVPSIFLLVDYFIPIFYLLLILMLFYFSFKIFLKEFFYKFIVDFLSLYLVTLSKNFKFSDVFLNNLNSKGCSLVSFSSFINSSFFFGLIFMLLIFLMFFIFLMF